MVEKVTGGKALPLEVLQQIVSKTDGVPLFVEELTKMVLESGLLREEDGHYVGAHGGTPIPPLAIPSTLQDSLMARLDRLAPVREIAQVGAVLGREFSYELLQAVSSLDEALLQQGLRQLVEAELIYQRGLPPQATYLFKHALIQDTAYQSLLKSRRQQLASADCPGVGGAVSRDERDPARTAGPSLHRGGTHRASHSLLAAGRTESQSALGLCGSDQPPHQRAGVAQDPARHS